MTRRRVLERRESLARVMARQELGGLEEGMEPAMAGGALGEAEARNLGFIYSVIGSYGAP